MVLILAAELLYTKNTPVSLAIPIAKVWTKERDLNLWGKNDAWIIFIHFWVSRLCQGSRQMRTLVFSICSSIDWHKWRARNAAPPGYQNHGMDRRSQGQQLLEAGRGKCPSAEPGAGKFLLLLLELEFGLPGNTLLVLNFKITVHRMLGFCFECHSKNNKKWAPKIAKGKSFLLLLIQLHKWGRIKK